MQRDKKQLTQEEINEKILLCTNDLGHYGRQLRSLKGDLVQTQIKIEALNRKIAKKNRYLDQLKNPTIEK